MKILITGVAGYIGSTVLKSIIYKDKIKQIIGIDKLLYTGKSLLPFLSYKKFKFIKTDINNVEIYKDYIDDETIIIHLAAIVGEPASKKKPEETINTNIKATKKLINLAIDKNIKKFIFASTCSNYGKVSKDNFANEETSLNPLSLYARTKVEIENYLIKKISNSFNWTILRFATVYGTSPRMRFDLTINDFTMHALKDKKLVIYLPYSNRPYIHVIDIARAINLIIDNINKTKNEIFNVGNTKENYKKIEIVKNIKSIIGNFDVEFINKGKDERDYKVSFEKIKKLLNFYTTKKITDGIKEIEILFKNNIITDFNNIEYYNV